MKHPHKQLQVYQTIDDLIRDSWDEDEDWEGNRIFDLNQEVLMYNIMNFALNVAVDTKLQKQCIKLLEERYIDDE